MNWNEILKYIMAGAEIGTAFLPPTIALPVNIALQAGKKINEAVDEYAALNRIPPEQLRAELLARCEQAIAEGKLFAAESRERILNG